MGVTMKLASTEAPVPEARIETGPADVGGTIMLAVHSPRSSAGAYVSVRPSPTVTVMLSIGLNPEPVSLKTIPGEPLERASLRPAPNVSVTAGTLVARVTVPEAWTLWEPAGSEGAMKEAVQDPFGSAEIPEATEIPSRLTKIPASFAEKPAPVTVTEVPAEALRWTRETDGVIVKPV